MGLLEKLRPGWETDMQIKNHSGEVLSDTVKN